MPTTTAFQIANSTVLALEPNPEQAVALRRACDLARTTLTLVRSKDEFLETLEDSLPDLILLPSFLPAGDESQLSAHLRALTDSSHMQVLLTPHSLTCDAAPRGVPPRGWRRLLTGHSSPPNAPSCDPHSFAERITWALESAQEARQALAERNQWLYASPGSTEDRRIHSRHPASALPWLQVARIKNGPRVKLVDLSAGGVLLETGTRMHRGSSGLLELVGEGRETVCSFRVLRSQPSPWDPTTPYRLACAFTEPFDLESVLHQDVTMEGALAPFMRSPEDHCDRDHRRTRGEVPWLSSVKLPWGLEVDVLNISRTGMLIETNSRFTPGTATEFQLSGPDTNLAVSAQFVRSEVASVGPRGVRYQAAARFTNELKFRDRPQSSSVASAPMVVAELLAVLGDLEPGADRAPLRTRFAERLLTLVPAREIQITNSPAGPPEGTESIYFSVPANGSSSAVLQATFEPDYELSEVEFRSLRTAATLASVVLDLERQPS